MKDDRKYFLFAEVRSFGLKMPKEMINFTLDRKGNEPWGFVIVGGKDQVTFCHCHCLWDLSLSLSCDNLSLLEARTR